jgi:hypothetical protein
MMTAKLELYNIEYMAKRSIVPTYIIDVLVISNFR